MTTAKRLSVFFLLMFLLSGCSGLGVDCSILYDGSWTQFESLDMVCAKAKG